MTSSPGPLATGRLSPVIMDSSTAELPSQDAVDRDPLARPDHDDVSRRTSSMGISASRPSRTTRAVPGREADELPDGVGGPALGPGLEHPAEEDEDDDQGRRVEIDRGHDPGPVEKRREEGCRRAVDIGRGRADGDERVHVGGPVPDSPPGPAIEPGPEDELDGRRQGPEDVWVPEEGRDPGEPMAHGPQEDEDADDRAGDDLGPEGPVFLLAEGPFRVARRAGRIRADDLVTGGSHGLAEPGQSGRVGEVFDSGHGASPC